MPFKNLCSLFSPATDPPKSLVNFRQPVPLEKFFQAHLLVTDQEAINACWTLQILSITHFESYAKSIPDYLVLLTREKYPSAPSSPAKEYRFKIECRSAIVTVKQPSSGSTAMESTKATIACLDNKSRARSSNDKELLTMTFYDKYKVNFWHVILLLNNAVTLVDCNPAFGYNCHSFASLFMDVVLGSQFGELVQPTNSTSAIGKWHSAIRLAMDLTQLPDPLPYSAVGSFTELVRTEYDATWKRLEKDTKARARVAKLQGTQYKIHRRYRVSEEVKLMQQEYEEMKQKLESIREEIRFAADYKERIAMRK
ncbi:hypothetical protein H0H93_009333 [Arthromyces matolae]|nr:hypothetical protein H0H93_009333 [Arthromyces matolae]